MYHCYLRAKQYELLAVRSCLPKIVQKNMAVIIEPVRENSRDLYSCLRDAQIQNVRVILIVNPKCGELEGNQRLAEQLVDGAIDFYPQVELGYIVDDTTSYTQLNSFFTTYQQQSKSIIHMGSYANAQQLLNIECSDVSFKSNIFIDGKCSTNYISNFSNTTKVLIRDGLNRTQTNAGYADNIIEFFSDLHLNYAQLGFQGFGDFSIVGDHFAEGGGQAITAVIHLTYENVEKTEILVHHFLSDPRVVAEDVAILIDEALEKLEAFVTTQRPDILNWSTACQELISIYRTPGERTNLAYIKKMTIKNHFELMHDIL
ncbi:sce7725 family protein [Pantoea sp. Al-1710]|jgi:hypothetical protein|uniref:Sce7725 family protein n=1 Tax=Candidatus Pantoea communis TaxID=2608354 RepID=A0ABX0RV74_9GAMM|nr:sce7725 family protein [Pantoea communis]MDF7631569.1 sce7725 family protein [Erwiniaceae bacterium L1_55_4]NIG19619.1 sce7725 family protein [Pantoea communis]